MKYLFYTIFYNPLHDGLLFLTKILPFNDLGLAIIVLTICVRFIIFPFSHKSVVTQRKIKQIEPEISKVKEKFKNDRQEQTKQVMALYKNHGISPFSGFLMLFIQLPIFFALFLLLRSGIDFSSQANTVFLGVIDITKSNYFISFLAAISQFFQIRLAMPKNNSNNRSDTSFGSQLQKSMSIQMKYIMPIFIFFVAQRFSSGLALYWTTSNVFAIVHEIIVARKAKKELFGINQSKTKNGRSNKNNKVNNSRVFSQTNN